MEEKGRTEKVDEALDLLGLRSLENQLPMTLSGGEKQKVAFARALVIEPKIVLLDEPLSSLDAEAKRGLKEELKRIHRDLSATVVHVTHDLVESFSLAEQVAIMKSGRIVQTGNAKEVFATPRDEFVARFLGYENIFKGRLLKYRKGLSLLDVDGHTIKVAEKVKNTECVIGIRPEDIMVSRKSVSSDSWNTFKGILQDYMASGPVVTITVDSGILFKVTISKRSFLQMNRDNKLWIAFKATSVKILG